MLYSNYSANEENPQGSRRYAGMLHNKNGLVRRVADIPMWLHDAAGDVWIVAEIRVIGDTPVAFVDGMPQARVASWEELQIIWAAIYKGVYEF